MRELKFDDGVENHASKPMVARLTIPLVSEDDHTGQLKDLLFRQWLPFKEVDSFAVQTEGLNVRLWVDLDCVRNLGGVSLESIGKHVNLYVGKVYADVTGIDVSAALTGLIEQLAKENNWQEEHIASTYDSKLMQDYHSIASRVYLAVINQFIRLIGYVRAVKGQYWLEEQQPDAENLPSELSRLRAKVRIGESSWVRLTSGGINVTRIVGTLQTGERNVAREDWLEAADYLRSNKKAPLVGQLLASADAFRESQHRRASLTEAVAALEVAVSQFARRANPESWSALLSNRSDPARFQKHVEHLGTTCTLGYLFPVIFSEEQIPATTLRKCQDAINERNTVVHQGQRDVDEERLRGYLRAIRDLCDRLRRFEGDEKCPSGATFT